MEDFANIILFVFSLFNMEFQIYSFTLSFFQVFVFLSIISIGFSVFHRIFRD